MTTSTEEYKAKLSAVEELRQVRSSRVRCWGVVLGHLLCAPVASIVYSSKTQKWAPTIAGTAAFAVGVPLSVIDVGFTAGIVAPAASMIMTINQVQEDRRRKGFIGPEDADMAFFTRSF